MEDEEAELVALIEMGHIEQPRKHEQRSWSLLQHARNERALKRARREAEAQSQRRETAERVVDLVAAQSSHAALAAGVRIRRTPMDETRACLMAKLAFLPMVRGALPARASQARAVDLTARCIMRVQAQRARDLFLGGGASLGGPEPSFRVAVLSWQWDETSQHLQNVHSRRLRAERVNHGGAAVQVMMQSGCMCLYYEVDGEGRAVAVDPYFSRALLLPAQTADTMVEGLLRRMPFDLSDPGVVHSMARGCDVLVFGMTVDRCSSNFSVMSWLCQMLTKAGMPDNVLLFAEPCAPHGVALLKGRLSVPGSLVARSHTFSRLMRSARFTVAFRDALLTVLRSRLRIENRARPAEAHEWSLSIADLLLGGCNANWLHTVGRDGTRAPSTLLREVQELCAVMDLGAQGNDITHYCYVLDGSPEHQAGAKVGDKCCATPEEALEKMAVPVINLLVQRPWDRSSENRWTYVLVTLRRLGLGFLSARLLPDALRDMRTHWGLNDSFVAMLERMVAAEEHGEFQNANKLRLARVEEAFGAQTAPFALALEITVLSQIDGMLYEVLGGSGKEAAKLAKLVSESDSVVAAAEQGLCRLLQAWGPDAPRWRLLSAFGCRFEGTTERLGARSAVLSLCAAVFDYFSLRLSEPPYTLAKLGDPAVEAADRLAFAQDFLQRPTHCMSMFCRRVRQRCPTAESLMREAPLIMGALNCAVPVGVDFTERAHATMRRALATGGRARNATPIANRVLCQQACAEHLKRSGIDMATALVPLPSGPPGQVVAEAHAPSDLPLVALPSAAKSRRGGNAFMSWHNVKLAAYKKRHAPDGPLTPEQLTRFRAAAKEEWEAMPAAEKEEWRRLWLAEREQRLAAQAPEDLAPRPPQSPPLWGSSDPRCPLPMSEMVRLHRETPYQERRRRARHDADLWLPQSEVPRRCESRADLRDLFCCWASRKNVCRQVLPSQVATTVDALATRLSSWVAGIGASAARKCDQLLWLHCEGLSTTHHADLLVLLVDARLRPQMQVFVHCIVPAVGNHFVLSLPPFPFVARIACAPSKVSRSFESVAMCTSDSLCLEMAKLGGRWTYRPLTWSLLEDATDLLHMRVEGAQDAIMPKARRPRQSKLAPEFALLQSFGDEGGEEGHRTSDVERGAPPGASHAQDVAREGLQGGLQEAGSELEEEDFAGLPDDVVDDLLAELGHSLAADPWAADLTEVAPDGGASEEEGEASEPEAMAKAVALAESCSGARSPPTSTGEGLADAAPGEISISPLGYISSTGAEWASVTTIGRITTWPSHELVMNRRSVSMRCYLHPGCSGPARRRWAVSDDDLCRWLLSGVIPEAGASRERRVQLAREHMARWKTLGIDAGKAAKSAAARGGNPGALGASAAASSSSGAP